MKIENLRIQSENPATYVTGFSLWRSGRDSPAGSKTVHRTVFAGVAVALFESLSLNTMPKKRENA
jgi:hypothetical protein